MLRPDSRNAEQTPSLGAVLQLLPELINEDPTTVAETLRDRYGYVVHIPSWHPGLETETHLITHPDDVQFVLQSDATKFGGLDIPGTRDFGRVMSNNIVSLTPDSEEGSWIQRTRMMSPEFSEHVVHRQIPDLAEITLATLAELTSESGQSMGTGSSGVPDAARVQPSDGEGVRLLPAMRRLTLRLLEVSLFSGDLRAHELEIIDAVDTLRSRFKERQLHVMTSPVIRRLPDELHLPTWLQDSLGTDPYIALADRTENRSIERLRGIAASIVERRRQTPLVFDDAFSTWLSRPDSVTGDVLTPETLRNEVIGLIIAGHATTSAALTWAFYLLASRPDVQERIRTEASETRLLASVAEPQEGGDPAAFDAADISGSDVFEALSYTRQVWKETLRLYPPLPLFGRSVKEDVVVRGSKLNAGSHVLLSPYVTHRDETFWDEPERFDPSRFAADRSGDRHEFAYFPFSGGPHACLGEAMATTEAATVLATTLATHYVEFPTDTGSDGELDRSTDAEVPERQSVGVDSAINLQPDQEITVRFVPRS